MGLKLAQAQFGRGDLHAQYVTCLLLQRELEGARLGSGADECRRLISDAIEQRRAQARALGISP